MGLGKSKQSTGRPGYPGNVSSTSHYGASHYSQKQGYGAQNRNHGAATARQLGTKPQHQHQQHQQHQQNLQYQQQQQALHKQHHHHVLKHRNKNAEEECFVCGHKGHSGLRCNHRKMTCFICNQTGHLRSVCTQKHHPESIYKPKPKPNQPNNTAQRSTKPKRKP